MTDSSASSDSGRISGAALLTLLLLCAAQFMLIVDVVVVNVAVPSIRADLGIPDSRLPLISVSYTLTFGSLLIAFGRAGDLVGRRRLFMIGMTVFTLASLATGLAQTEWQLVASRAGQGIGAAMVSPTALALLTTAFTEGAGRNRALGYWGAVGSGGAIAGQLLGGVITDTVGWRGIFLINVPIGIAALVLARYHLRESRSEQRPALDVRGAVLLTAALAMALLGLTEFAEGRNTVLVAGLAIACVAAFALFIRVERGRPAPLVDARVVRSGNVARANVLFAVSAGMLAAALFFTTLYLQVVLGYSPLAVGMAFAPITLLILAARERKSRPVPEARNTAHPDPGPRGTGAELLGCVRGLGASSVSGRRPPKKDTSSTGTPQGRAGASPRSGRPTALQGAVRGTVRGPGPHR